MVRVNPTQAKQLLLILKTGLNGKSWPKSASSYLTGGLKEFFFLWTSSLTWTAGYRLRRTDQRTNRAYLAGYMEIMFTGQRMYEKSHEL